MSILYVYKYNTLIIDVIRVLLEELLGMAVVSAVAQLMLTTIMQQAEENRQTQHSEITANRVDIGLHVLGYEWNRGWPKVAHGAPRLRRLSFQVYYTEYVLLMPSRLIANMRQKQSDVCGSIARDYHAAIAGLPCVSSYVTKLSTRRLQCSLIVSCRIWSNATA